MLLNCTDRADVNNDEGAVEEADNDVQEGEVLGAAADGSQRFVTAREYYCYKLQIRRGIFNILLYGGRLFQQWAVDMYVKIESMRLNWYSNPANQKLIRAELYQVRNHNYVNLVPCYCVSIMFQFYDTCLNIISI